MHVLYADDETTLQTLMKNQLEKLGHSVVVCPDGPTAVAALEREPFDCLIVDLDMPGMKGAEVIERAKKIRPDIEAVVITGKPDLQSALTAIDNHVFAFLTKPCSFKQIKSLLSEVYHRLAGSRRLAALEHRVRQTDGDGQLVGNGSAMDQVRQVIKKVAPTDSTVMIRGETGCGKELVARAVHNASLRAGEPMVSINCGALPENLIESELFGHVKGAFTGADNARVGLFEVADGGTIFLDEIGELPLMMQAKLLRVLETGDIRRLGSNQSKRVDVRVICATHRDLEKMVQEDQFREDLMFRINTFEIHVPSLRERTEDIMPLAEHLLRRHRSDCDDNDCFTAEATTELLAHKWPGNVRELANVVEHAAILCDKLPIDADCLPRHFSRRKLRNEIRESGPMTIREMEMMAIDRAIERNGGDKKAAAEELGISVKTLYNKLNSAEEKAA
ncbi:sigma-54-dependent transcriptional regulator [Rhodopirellula sp. MGV]|uniref:sigma-54-dependent transcriptional regulator n=1 Tax=Rhodopirellula sp. MGV TaxID=2023130 RepID=UPI000B95FE43|nr:sigma-54 dependent transcriptional regulator [Rhodopirellula sp. MGV]OYP28986.1 transcriptional regulator [Rhodopirellula sp. MGV]PNY37049.1 sigma-54-dependent Fis family transcriptional regulator [Rhodopirellula baltica]